MAYVDTNVILAKYFPEEKLRTRAIDFLDRTKGKKFVSPVSVVELAAVLSRLNLKLQAPNELLEQTPRRRIRALVEFLIRDSNLFLASVTVQAKVKIAKTVLSLPMEYHSCIRLAHVLKLKTLDLIHLSYADSLRRLGYEVDAFVTFDKDILARSDDIRNETEIEVKEPSGS